MLTSKFSDVLSKIMETPPIKGGESRLLKAERIDTPLGPMIAIADEKALYLLEFIDYRRLEREIGKLRKATRSVIVPGTTAPIQSIEKELHLYFKGSLQFFQTPIKMVGSSFQKEVWLELQKIPMGKTCSYSEIAKMIQRPSAVRAVAGANGANPLVIVIPCHRVISANGGLGGYSSGLERKERLLSLEETYGKA